MELKKNQICTVTIEDMGSEGQGIGRYQGFLLFVKDAVVGDVVKVKILKLKKTYGYAKIEKIEVPSPDRVEPLCPVAVKCGGCTMQQLSYEKQLEFKQKKVRDCLVRIGKIEDAGDKMEPIIGMEQPFHYRNKAQFPVGYGKNGIAMGFYAGHSHTIIDCQNCYLQQPVNEEILTMVKEYMEEYDVLPYDETTHRGTVRHILTRVGFHSGEIMVCLVINAKKLPFADELSEMLSQIEGMTSISYNINCDKTNRIMGEQTVTVWGKDTIKDAIKDVWYEISPRSFYQVNPLQTEALYEKALSYAMLDGDEIVWDIYCGIGTISLFLAKKAKHVYGVEIVPEAIKDAKRNAALNGFSNTTFYVGKAEEVLPEQYEKHGIKADVIVVDPPRKGCDKRALETMVKMQPKRIVYVSCDPATLARDVNWLGENGYQLDKICPVDMFPMGGHVEVVTCLQRVNS